MTRYLVEVRADAVVRRQVVVRAGTKIAAERAACDRVRGEIKDALDHCGTVIANHEGCIKLPANVVVQEPADA